MTGKLLYLSDMEADGIFDATQALKYSSTVEVIDEVLAANPAATVADIRQYAAVQGKLAETQLTEADARMERAVYRHCEIEIVRGSDGTWWHGSAPSWGSRGCRSYSFQRLGTWDDTLDSRWKAAPA